MFQVMGVRTPTAAVDKLISTTHISGYGDICVTGLLKIK